MGRDPSTDLTQGIIRAREKRKAKEAQRSEHIQSPIQTTSKPKLTFKQKLMQPVITGIVRHILTALGGGLVGDGFLDQDQLNGGIGAVVLLVSLGWSIYSNKKAADKGAK